LKNRLVDFRKLVALDILLHGRPFILAELGIATPILLAIGVQQIAAGLPNAHAINLVLGFYLTLTGMNYVPLLLYAVIISKKNSAEKEGEAELELKSKYNRQQFLVFVPMLVFWIVVGQELTRPKEPIPRPLKGERPP